MPLTGGSIWIKKTSDVDIENILNDIIEDRKTRIELLQEASFGPECVYKLHFDNAIFSKFFETTGNSVTPRVLIIKVLTHDEYYNEDTKVSSPYLKEHSFEVDIQRHLSLSDKNHYPICPGFLYSKVTKLGEKSKRGENKPRTLEENFCKNLYNTSQIIYEVQEQPVMENGKIVIKKQNVPLNVNLYERLASETERLLTHENPRLPPTFNFTHATQTIIFMEYLECATLSSIIRNSRSSDKYISDYMSNLHGMELPFADTRISTASKETRITGFACFVLLYLSILLLNEGIIHGDLHPGNVLICRRDDKIDAVVIDFGRSAFTERVYVNQHLQIDESIKKFLLETTLLTIFNEITRYIPKGKDFIEMNMAPYFDSLIDNKEYVKAAIASTMCRSTNTKPTVSTVYDFYIEQLYLDKKDQLFMYIFQYEAFPGEYNFTQLITYALKEREQFNKLLDNCQYLMKMHGIGSSADYIDWLKKNHPDKGGKIDSGIFTELNNCKKAGKYYKQHPIAKAAREKEVAETKARLAADKAAADEKAKLAKALADEEAEAKMKKIQAENDKIQAERAKIQAERDKNRQEERHKLGAEQARKNQEEAIRHQEEAIRHQEEATRHIGRQAATQAAKIAQKKQEEKEKAQRKQKYEEARRKQEQEEEKRQQEEEKRQQEEERRQQEREKRRQEKREKEKREQEEAERREEQKKIERAQNLQKRREERAEAMREEAERLRKDNMVNNLAEFNSVNEQQIRIEQERLAALEMQESATHNKTKKNSVLSGFRRGISNLVSSVRGTQSKKTNTSPIYDLPFSSSSARRGSTRGPTSAPIDYIPSQMLSGLRSGLPQSGLPQSGLSQSGLPQHSGPVRIGGKRRTFKHYKKTKNKKRRKRKTKARY
jgi:hypothetical protein